MNQFQNRHPPVLSFQDHSIDQVCETVGRFEYRLYSRLVTSNQQQQVQANRRRFWVRTTQSLMCVVQFYFGVGSKWRPNRRGQYIKVLTVASSKLNSNENFNEQCGIHTNVDCVKDSYPVVCDVATRKPDSKVSITLSPYKWCLDFPLLNKSFNRERKNLLISGRFSVSKMLSITSISEADIFSNNVVGLSLKHVSHQWFLLRKKSSRLISQYTEI